MTTPVTAQERFAIQDLLMAYVWATDTGDHAAYAATFTEDGTLMTSKGERITGHHAIEAYSRIASPEAGNRGRQHLFQTIRVHREGAGFRVFSFWQVADMKAEPRAARIRSMGSCDDLCVPTPDGLRFAERRIAPWNDRDAPWVG